MIIKKDVCCGCDRGITAYAIAILKARFYLHSNFANVKVAVLSSFVDKSLGCVRFHWCINAFSQKQAFAFWKFRFFQFKEKANADSALVFYSCIIFYSIFETVIIYEHTAVLQQANNFFVFAVQMLGFVDNLSFFIFLLD